MAGLLGHGDAFVFRDPAGIRPAYFYQDDEIVVVASERPVIQTVFNVPFESVKEIDPGSALIIKKSGNVSMNEILIQPLKKHVHLNVFISQEEVMPKSIRKERI